jgi:hypothetical protein
MHGKRTIVKEVRYGSNESAVFLRIDFADDVGSIEGLEVQAEMANGDGRPEQKLRVTVKSGAALVESSGGTAAFQDVMEISLPATGDHAQVRLSFWRDGLPIQAIPPQDYLHISAASGWSA